MRGALGCFGRDRAHRARDAGPCERNVEPQLSSISCTSSALLLVI